MFGNTLSSDVIFFSADNLSQGECVTVSDRNEKNTNVQTILLLSYGKRDTPPMYQMKFKTEFTSNKILNLKALKTQKKHNFWNILVPSFGPLLCAEKHIHHIIEFTLSFYYSHQTILLLVTKYYRYSKKLSLVTF